MYVKLSFVKSSFA